MSVAIGGCVLEGHRGTAVRPTALQGLVLRVLKPCISLYNRHATHQSAAMMMNIQGVYIAPMFQKGLAEDPHMR